MLIWGVVKLSNHLTYLCPSSSYATVTHTMYVLYHNLTQTVPLLSYLWQLVPGVNSLTLGRGHGTPPPHCGHVRNCPLSRRLWASCYHNAISGRQWASPAAFRHQRASLVVCRHQRASSGICISGCQWAHPPASRYWLVPTRGGLPVHYLFMPVTSYMADSVSTGLWNPPKISPKVPYT